MGGGKFLSSDGCLSPTGRARVLKGSKGEKNRGGGQFSAVLLARGPASPHNQTVERLREEPGGGSYMCRCSSYQNEIARVRGLHRLTKTTSGSVCFGLDPSLADLLFVAILWTVVRRRPQRPHSSPSAHSSATSRAQQKFLGYFYAWNLRCLILCLG